MTLERSTRPVLACIVTVLFLAVTHAAAAAPACNDTVGDSSFRLDIVHDTAFEEQSATREEMDRIAGQIGASAAVREAHPLMLIIAQAGAHVEFAHRPIEVRDAVGKAYFCDIPISIVLRVGVFRRQVILHENATKDACVRTALLDHYFQHSHVLDETVDRFAIRHRAELADALYDLTRKTAPDTLSATRELETGLDSLISSLYQSFKLEIRRSRLVVDTPAALEQLRNACEGRLQYLEREFGSPGDRHASFQPFHTMPIRVFRKITATRSSLIGG